ncbi:hypothetical protein ABWH92_13825 [Ahrensia marina]|uniref:hypothetical protein n=1 Tax=Ahrensia marina TaxID=1514904 RepID=UPI0035CFC0D1
MSGLSLADMRRIGAERNQTSGLERPAKPSLLSKLPFARSDDPPSSSRPKKSPVDRLSKNDRHVAGRAEAVEDATSSSMLVTPTASVADTQRASITHAETLKPLQQNTLRHAAVGGGAGVALGLAASGTPIALPAGALVGALAGNMVGKRAQRIATDNAKTVILKPKQAPKLFETARDACGLVECAEGSLNISIDQSAAVHAVTVGSSRRSGPRGYRVRIGLAVLVGLGARQIEALVAHALVCAKLANETEAVDGETIQRLNVLSQSLSKRSRLTRLSNVDALEATHSQAVRAFHISWEERARQADRLAARYAGPRALVEALLAQALLAARFWQDAVDGGSYAQSLQALRNGYGRSQLDGALHSVAQDGHPSADAAAMGMPIALLERVANLDTSCSVPVLPSFNPAFLDLPPSTQKALERRLSKPEKPPKEKQGKLSKPKTKELTGERNAKRERASKDQGRSKSLVGKLLGRGRKTKDVMPDLDPHQQPLYNADALYKNDPGVGLEAYQALVDANPRWSLARLRMAEAQIEMGNPDCVANLMTCAERLPSALPTILDRLQSALAMVSPLEEEPLRQAVANMQKNASAIAQERAEIDLEKLGPCSLDAEDQDTLKALFSHSAGLREAWVLNVPCASMPDVPHHAVLGLAPRLGAEDAQAMAMTLAEHAAVTGTVAVHIETGTPRGALGDTLATYPSLWRASNR